MQLDSNFTKITADEHCAEEITLTGQVPLVQSRYWVAELDGISTKGEHIQMERPGKTPDDAIKNLFEAMSDADVTL